MADTTEQVRHFSEDGELLGIVNRHEADTHEYIIETVVVLVMTSDGMVLVQKRPRTKRIFPGLFDVSTAGAVSYPEEPLDGARRELLEETGLQLELQHIDTFIHTFASSPGNPEFKRVVNLYLAMSDTEHELEPNDEVANFDWQHYQDLLDLSQACPQLFVPAYRPELELAIEFALSKGIVK